MIWENNTNASSDTKKTILVVDDLKINRRILKGILQDEYNVIEADDGDNAIDLIGKLRDRISLVLLDLNMPKISGYEVLHALGELGLDDQVPAVVITASEDAGDELKAYEYGAVEFIRKPFSTQVVRHRVQILIELYESKKAISQALAAKDVELADAQKTDSVTGLLNMREFIRTAQDFLDELPDSLLGNYVLVYRNISGFKRFNSKYGTDKGDYVLRYLADIVTAYPDTLFSSRLNADHFVSLTKADKVFDALVKCGADFDEKFRMEELSYTAGIYRLSDRRLGIYNAIEMSKAACDSAISQHESVKEYDDALERKIRIEKYVQNNIDKAIEQELIQVYYQPVVRTITGAISGAEALSRWIDPAYGFLSPADFIPALENTGLVYKVDKYVLRKVCRMLSKLQGEGRQVVPISVNLSRTDFFQFDVVDYIEEVAREFDVTRDLLKIEITESAMMQDEEAVNESVNRLN